MARTTRSQSEKPGSRVRIRFSTRHGRSGQGAGEVISKRSAVPCLALGYLGRVPSPPAPGMTNSGKGGIGGNFGPSPC